MQIYLPELYLLRVNVLETQEELFPLLWLGCALPRMGEQENVLPEHLFFPKRCCHHKEYISSSCYTLQTG